MVWGANSGLEDKSRVWLLVSGVLTLDKSRRVLRKPDLPGALHAHFQLAGAVIPQSVPLGALCQIPALLLILAPCLGLCPPSQGGGPEGLSRGSPREECVFPSGLCLLLSPLLYPQRRRRCLCGFLACLSQLPDSTTR